MRRRAEVARHLQGEPRRRRHRARASRGSRSRCAGTHCSTALVTTTSASGGGVQSTTSSLLGVDPPLARRGHHLRRRVQALTAASGQRADSTPVRWPGPQPRSTTRRGATAPTRASRSWNGRERWSSKSRYSAGSQVVLTPNSTLVLFTRPDARWPRSARDAPDPRTASASVPGSARTCSTTPSRPATVRCTNHAPPPGRSRWCRLLIEPVTRSCTASGTRPGLGQPEAARRLVGDEDRARDRLDLARPRRRASAPPSQVALLIRCQPRRRGRPGSHSPREVATTCPPPATSATATHVLVGLQHDPLGQGGSAQQPVQPGHRTSGGARSLPERDTHVARRHRPQRDPVLLQRHEIAEELVVGVGLLDGVGALQPRLQLRDLRLHQREPHTRR